ncbi:MAG: hypothetical protein QM715_15520 [Nibricoccus sp.]
MRHLLSLLLFAAVSLTASARLGENEQELIKRFGQPLSQTPEKFFAQGKFITIGTALTFQQESWRITAVLTENRCSKITYTHPGDWTENQFTTTLTANCQASKWTDTSSTDQGFRKLSRNWKRADGGTASWTMAGTSLVITNPAYNRTKEKAEAKAKAETSRIPKI